MTHIENKKIALRFLKELGLYILWKEYTKEEHGSFDGWHEKKYIDDVFGMTSFTAHLRRKYNIRLYSSVSDIFRYYLIYNKMDYNIRIFMTEIDIEDVLKDININHSTNKFSLKIRCFS